jgi:hypothetical protein
MRAHICYLSYVLRHKWFVLLEGLNLQAPFLALVLHDWTKFLPSEWFGYVNYFYGGPYRSIYEFSGDERNFALSAGCYKEKVAEDFDYAWLHHQKRNRHHWQYWVMAKDDGSVYPLKMPYRDVLEMVADWRGAGRAVGKPQTAAWYVKNQDRMQLHPDTRVEVESILGLVRVKDLT